MTGTPIRGEHTVHRFWLGLFALLLAACSGSGRDYSETNIADLHDQMQRGEISSEELVTWYLDRIDAIDRSGPALNAMIEVNPDALDIARALDREWQASGPRGPLHGIPVVLKANIDTADQMATSAGSLALADHVPAEDAFLVKRLRNAGAVILGKANLSEWANFRSTRSSSGWSSVGGQTLNPYDTTRTPCGSSSGSAVAVAANLTVVAVGTETDGSVVCPSGITGIVGIKPTLGLVSRSGIIPIAHSQDTAGPMARSVRDAAILLTAMTGVDTDDAATADAEIHHDYSANLTADGLDGKRIGVIRSFYGAGSNPHIEELLEASIAALREQGAEIVDDIEIATEGMNDAEYEVLLYEFKADLNAYLAASGTPVTSLAQAIEFNDANAARIMPIFGQEIFHEAEAKGPLTDEAYLEALETSKRIAREGLDGALAEHRLDALIAPTNGPAWKIDHANGDAFHVGSSSLAAISGYPSITVPAGFVANLPIGISFVGKPWNEKQLIEIAYAFEQAVGARRAPDF
ncbi:MAG: amidase [Gammaproteobacteria bacterium]|nr:amidase [Gammaproteobacteria bacterium]